MLTKGQRLGPYEIVAPLGKGGMGEVWRARDTRLGREVALKFLPEDFAEDAERHARFEREAKVLASLSHPNVAHIYGVEEAGGVDALVLELVEGETLAERIAQGALPIDEALEFARQIADALEAAHEKGIVHRDLKPANVKITPQGRVKVLDFGLAKAIAGDPSSPDATQSPTITAAATQAGVVIGTAAYMSPEQARGRAVDKRSDIWAFGAVVYEMLTGRKAFEGETISDTLAAVLRADVDWSALPSDTPAAVRRVLKRCLDRDLKTRFHDVADARIAMDEVQDAGVVAAPSVAAPARRASLVPWLAAALAALAAALLTAAILRRSGVRSAPVYAFLDPPPKMNWQLTGDEAAPPVVAPDGLSVVFGAGGKLWVRSLRTGGVAPVAGTEGGTFPFWSADSRSIGFFAGGKLRTVEASGGPPQSLADAPTPRGGAWGPDGTIVYAPDFQGGLFRVPASGGTSKAITQVDATRHSTHRWPWMLPDGKHVLFLAASHLNPRSEASGIYVVSVDGGPATRLLAAYGSAQTVPGWLLSVSEGHLVAWPFDAERLTLGGEARRIPVEANFDYGTWRGVFSVSRNGILVYQTLQEQARGQLQWMDLAGHVTATVGEPNNSFALRLSPDGTRASIIEGDPNSDLWVYELDRGFRTRLTTNEQVILTPIWTRDGSEIFYVSGTSATVGSDYKLMRRPSSGGGKATEVARSKVRIEPTDVTPDGKILVADRGPIGNTAIWIYPLADPNKASALMEATGLQTDGRVSPDGRWMSFTALQGGRLEVFVVAFPSGTGRQQVSAAGGNHARWAPDGRTLYFVSQDNELMSAAVDTQGGPLRVKKAESLFPVQLFTGPRVSGALEITPDGKRFLVNSSGNVEPPSIRLVTNWSPEPETK
ncbi:MAG TPA: protein kinase [Thermoanaerobaculia bacterium]|nr:protein kinase [Thermoanaerobaculia bacterium]